jgi:hypothetical protein
MLQKTLSPAAWKARTGPRNSSSRGADGPEFNQKTHSLQSPRQEPHFRRDAIESHVRLLHERGARCGGFLVLTPIWEGHPPRPQRFMVGAVSEMAAAIMAFDGVRGVNLYAQYGTMRRELCPGKKGGECDVELVFAAVADIDNDKVAQCEIQIEPSYIVESSPGNFQRVYIFPNPLPVIEAKPVLCALHAAVGGDSAQKDCSHVWRIPGTLNWPTKSKLARGRSPEPAPVLIASSWEGLLVDPEELLALAPPGKATARANKQSFEAGGTARLRSALAAIPSNDRGVWLRVGMACHTNGLRDVWDAWSQTSDKFDQGDQDSTWDHFKDRPGGITAGTIFHEAKVRGWR